MARPKKPTDELKDQRVPIMMSEDELKAIDDWRFDKRIGSRGEAIRRLCQIALVVAEHQRGIADDVVNIMQLIGDFKETRKTPSGGKSASSFLDDAIPEIYALVARAITVSSIARALESGNTLADAQAERDEMQALAKVFSENVETIRAERKAEIAKRRKD